VFSLCYIRAEETVPLTNGYTRKIYIPKNHLSETEQKILGAIEKINDTLSEEKEPEIIINRLKSIFSEIWKQDHRVSMEFDTNIGPRRTSDLETISIRFVLHKKPREEGCIFTISGTNSVQKDAKGFVRKVGICWPDEKYEMECSFYENGRLQGLGYIENFNLVKVIKTWSEDGSFLKEEIIDKPRPMNIQK
jgi:hypothetical protein